MGGDSVEFSCDTNGNLVQSIYDVEQCEGTAETSAMPAYFKGQCLTADLDNSVRIEWTCPNSKKEPVKLNEVLPAAIAQHVESSPLVGAFTQRILQLAEKEDLNPEMLTPATFTFKYFTKTPCSGTPLQFSLLMSGVCRSYPDWDIGLQEGCDSEGNFVFIAHYFSPKCDSVGRGRVFVLESKWNGQCQQPYPEHFGGAFEVDWKCSVPAFTKTPQGQFVFGQP
jgi:hypothetical protein